MVPQAQEKVGVLYSGTKIFLKYKVAFNFFDTLKSMVDSREARILTLFFQERNF